MKRIEEGRWSLAGVGPKLRRGTAVVLSQAVGVPCTPPVTRCNSTIHPPWLGHSQTERGNAIPLPSAHLQGEAPRNGLHHGLHHGRPQIIVNLVVPLQSTTLLSYNNTPYDLFHSFCSTLRSPSRGPSPPLLYFLFANLAHL